MARTLRKPKADHIEKPEDKQWQEWYGKLSKKDHEKYLSKLGLTDADQGELKEIKEGLEKTKAEPKDEDDEDQ